LPEISVISEEIVKASLVDIALEVPELVPFRVIVFDVLLDIVHPVAPVPSTILPIETFAERSGCCVQALVKLAISVVKLGTVAEDQLLLVLKSVPVFCQV
jgi:hypothetical protein